MSRRGRGGRVWARLTRQVYARRAACCRCGQPIDYALPYLDPITGKPDQRSKSVDHYPYPLSTHPHLAEDLSNLQAAHLGCNNAAGSDNPHDLDVSNLGEASESW